MSAGFVSLACRRRPPAARNRLICVNLHLAPRRRASASERDSPPLLRQRRPTKTTTTTTTRCSGGPVSGRSWRPSALLAAPGSAWLQSDPIRSDPIRSDPIRSDRITFVDNLNSLPQAHNGSSQSLPDCNSNSTERDRQAAGQTQPSMASHKLA